MTPTAVIISRPTDRVLFQKSEPALLSTETPQGAGKKILKLHDNQSCNYEKNFIFHLIERKAAKSILLFLEIREDGKKQTTRREKKRAHIPHVRSETGVTPLRNTALDVLPIFQDCQNGYIPWKI